MSLLNLAGAACYLKLASSGWVEPQAANIPGAAGGGAITWGLTALPVLALFSVFNLVVLPIQCVAHLKNREWLAATLAFLIPAFQWIIAVHIDYSHHGV